MTHAPHTRESDEELLARAEMCSAYVNGTEYTHKVIDDLCAALRRISTPIPLTPSDGACRVALADLVDALASSDFGMEDYVLASFHRARAALSVPAPITPSDADMAYFSATDAACIHYPGEDQLRERDAYCCGARDAITTPITPSDEMVEAAITAYGESWKARGVTPEWPGTIHMKAALTAALNLMGGDK